MTVFLYQLTTYTDRINIYVQHIHYTCIWVRVLLFYIRCRLSKCFRCCMCLRKQFWIDSASMAVEISGVLENLQNQYSSKTVILYQMCQNVSDVYVFYFHESLGRQFLIDIASISVFQFHVLLLYVIVKKQKWSSFHLFDRLDYIQRVCENALVIIAGT